MATQTIIQSESSTYSSLTMTLFEEYTDTVVDSETATKGTNDPSLWSADFTDVAAGRYRLVMFNGSVPTVRDFVTLTLETETFPPESMLVGDQVNTLLSRVTSTVATLWTDMIAMITGSGVDPKFTETALENAPAGEGGGGGEGGTYIQNSTTTRIPN